MVKKQDHSLSTLDHESIRSTRLAGLPFLLPIKNPSLLLLARNPEYAGFCIRSLAVLVDTIIIEFFSFLLRIGGHGYAVPMLGYRMSDPNYNGLFMVLAFVYTLFFWIWKSATPGKLLLGIKIVNIDGQNLTFITAILRYIGYYFSSFVLFGFLWILFDEKKQALHDKLLVRM